MPNLQLGSSGVPAKNFHGVGISPLSKILAVKVILRSVTKMYFGAKLIANFKLFSMDLNINLERRV